MQARSVCKGAKVPYKLNLAKQVYNKTVTFFISGYSFIEEYGILCSINRNLWRIKLMNNKRIIIGVTIGITAAILWSVVFINVLNSMAGIGIGVCLGISFGISGSLIFSKK